MNERKRSKTIWASFGTLPKQEKPSMAKNFVGMTIDDFFQEPRIHRHPKGKEPEPTLRPLTCAISSYFDDTDSSQ